MVGITVIIYIFGFVLTGLSFVFVQEILLDNSVLVGPRALLILNYSSLQCCFYFMFCLFLLTILMYFLLACQVTLYCHPNQTLPNLQKAHTFHLCA